MATDLSSKILERAEQDKLPPDHELRKLAHDFATATAGLYADPPTIETKKFMGIWARTRRIWCEYSGESLI